jgi:polysaccharide biosynthesis/export protein
MKQIVPSLLVFFTLAPTAASHGAEAPSPPAAPATSASQPQIPAAKNPGYHIGPRDLIEIRVFETPEFSGNRRVSEDGKVTLPPVGDVEVAGLTETEAAQKIKAVLEAKVLQRASVAVQVQEFRARPISVIGSVRQPGNLSFSGRWTLLEALTAAGGIGDGHGDVVFVLRRADNGLSDQVAVSIDDLLVRADPRVNIPIYSGDLINVPGAVEVTVYCMGEVKQPGAVQFKSSDRITLLTVIARVGGLTDRASSKVLIKRASRAARGEETADFKRILAGKDPDVELRSGDVVVVKESFF